jgi:hypothetical protein
MGLIIDQGKQIVQEIKEERKPLEFIEAEQIQGVIEEITAHNFLEDNISVKVRIIDEPYKNRVVFGDANYNPTSKLNFTYQNLRVSAGFPYQPGENPKLDIEKLLLNKVVTMKLFIRDAKNGKQYQGVRWVPISPSVLGSKPEPKKESAFDDIDPQEYKDAFKDLLETEDPFKTTKKTTTKKEVSDWEDPVVSDTDLPF